jgi:tRNA U34 2-thiouridine synthase MnmA/TrmU
MKVLVALSGGPQSFVTAWLLKKQGMQVRGVYFDIFADDRSNEKMLDAERKLGIPIQIMSAKELLKETLIHERAECAILGRRVNAKQVFHQKILIPGLFQLSEQYKTEKIASGHRVTLQDDPAAGVMRVFRGIESKVEDSLLVLGIPQEKLKNMMLPLGSIPESMLSKLIGEVAPPDMTSAFEKDFDTIEHELLSGGLDLDGAEFKVLTVEGVQIGQGHRNEFQPGASYLNPETPDKFYRVKEIYSATATVVVQEEGNLKVQEIDFEEASWFQDEDLGLNLLETGLLLQGRDKALPIHLMQFEGLRVKGKLLEPLMGREADIFKGQSVLWVEGSEILGGARVLRIK